jgi:ribonuclease P protein component
VRNLLREGKRFRGRAITLAWRPGKEGDTRLAVMTPARLGGAVQRNRFRRVVREFLRQTDAEALRGAELVVMCRRPLGRRSELAAVGDLKTFLRTASDNRMQ